MMHTAGEWAAGYEPLRDDDADQLYERAPCGYMTLAPDGVIVKVNQTFLNWTGLRRHDLVDKRTFASLLTSGGQIYYETHLGPMLQLHGETREIALDIQMGDEGPLPVLINATLERYEDGRPRLVRLAVMDATDRREYERELVVARRRAEDAQERAVTLARTLQDTLLPPTLPDVPGLDVAAAYRPAGDGSEVGGDFYDLFQVAEGDWVLVLGDVCGKGVGAAIITALVRHTLRAATVMEPDPGRALHTLNAVMLDDEDDRFCTLVLMRMIRDGDEWNVTMAAGGHAPPLLIRDGIVASVPFEPGSLIGVLPEPFFTPTTFTLRAGDSLLLHTDGATEGRQGKAFFGESRLADSVRAHAGSTSGLIDGVLADVLDFQGGIASDDIALIALSVAHAP